MPRDVVFHSSYVKPRTCLLGEVLLPVGGAERKLRDRTKEALSVVAQRDCSALVSWPLVGGTAAATWFSGVPPHWLIAV